MNDLERFLRHKITSQEFADWFLAMKETTLDPLPPRADVYDITTPWSHRLPTPVSAAMLIVEVSHLEPCGYVDDGLPEVLE